VQQKKNAGGRQWWWSRDVPAFKSYSNTDLTKKALLRKHKSSKLIFRYNTEIVWCSLRNNDATSLGCMLQVQNSLDMMSLFISSTSSTVIIRHEQTKHFNIIRQLIEKANSIRHYGSYSIHAISTLYSPKLCHQSCQFWREALLACIKMWPLIYTHTYAEQLWVSQWRAFNNHPCEREPTNCIYMRSILSVARHYSVCACVCVPVLHFPSPVPPRALITKAVGAHLCESTRPEDRQTDRHAHIHTHTQTCTYTHHMQINRHPIK